MRKIFARRDHSSDEALAIQAKGGLAERAGKASAVISHKASQAFEKAKPVAFGCCPKDRRDAVNKGAYGVGKQLSNQRGLPLLKKNITVLAMAKILRKNEQFRQNNVQTKDVHCEDARQPKDPKMKDPKRRIEVPLFFGYKVGTADLFKLLGLLALLVLRRESSLLLWPSLSQIFEPNGRIE